MSPGTLHFFCGRIASGKTTAARALAAAVRAVMICEDEWLAGLFDGAQTFEQYLDRRKRIRSILEVEPDEELTIVAER